MVKTAILDYAVTSRKDAEDHILYVIARLKRDLERIAEIRNAVAAKLTSGPDQPKK